jgi:mannosyltransferase OCH1-like enzyme
MTMQESSFYKIKKNIRKLTEFPLVKIEDKIVNESDDSLIPNNVYQTWETRYLGKTHARSLNDFRNKNPTMSFHLYDKDRRDDYLKQNWSHHPIYKVYSNSLFGPMKADIFRYCILYDLGGYYFDIAKSCSLPLNQLHNKNHEGVITYEDTECFYPPNDEKLFKLKRPFNHFLQWGLAFSKKHVFLKNLIDEISDNYKFYKNINFENPKLAILNFTGPGVYTKVMRNFLSNNVNHSLNELDIKFNNYGVFKLKGSSIRHYIVPSYSYIANCKICT